MIVASLYTLPLMVLKSSASASDADSVANITSAARQFFTRWNPTRGHVLVKPVQVNQVRKGLILMQGFG